MPGQCGAINGECAVTGGDAGLSLRDAISFDTQGIRGHPLAMVGQCSALQGKGRACRCRATVGERAGGDSQRQAADKLIAIEQFCGVEGEVTACLQAPLVVQGMAGYLPSLSRQQQPAAA